MASDIMFKHPFTCIIGGTIESGKSTFCIRFLQNLDTVYLYNWRTNRVRKDYVLYTFFSES